MGLEWFPFLWNRKLALAYCIDAFSAANRKSTSPENALAPLVLREVSAKIIEPAAASNDGLVTYGDIWNAFSPNIPWEEHETLRIVADSLARVIH